MAKGFIGRYNHNSDSWETMFNGKKLRSNNYKDSYINQPFSEEGDGVRIEGENLYANVDDCVVVVSDCTIDFEDLDKDEMDENFSVVYGANAIIRNCKFINGKKLCLIGNGDTGATDAGHTVWFQNCVFEDFGRRGPELQDGYIVVMENCLIKNWGKKKYFDEKSFGVRACAGAQIHMKNCRFEQDSFFHGGFFNFFKDLFSQIGNSVNEYGISGIFKLEAWIPGVCKGASCGKDGEISAEGCTKNHRWIYTMGKAKYKK